MDTKQQIELLRSIANSISFLAEAVKRDDQNWKQRYADCESAKQSIQEFHKKADLILKTNGE